LLSISTAAIAGLAGCEVGETEDGASGTDTESADSPSTTADAATSEDTSTSTGADASGIGGAVMFRYDATNTGTAAEETGPTAAVTERWTFGTGDAVKSSPAVVDGTVYVGSDGGSVYALDAADGTEQWSTKFEMASVDSSPAVVDGTVYVGSDDGTVYALDES